MAEILEIARNGTLKTQIMYKANLSYAQLTEYVKFMICHNLLKKNSQGGKNIFRSTEKGLEFVRRHDEINELLKEENWSFQNKIRIPPENLLKKGKSIVQLD
ncbi:hypothetical protein KAI12_05495 [Candidatus Bathyarchaeota archaeon]|nr:hypothetical protein [Candidatus Bathyarchaeota archaeon]